MDPVTFGILVGLGLIGTAGYVLTRKQASTPSPVFDERQSRFKGLLKHGQLYRVWAHVELTWASEVRKQAPPGVTGQTFLSQTLTQALGKMGFDPVYLTSQDPTDSTVWVFIARWSLASDEAFDVPVFRLYQLQATTEPPGDITSAAAQAPGPPSLDPGITMEEAHAVGYAIASDDDPKHLGGFASTFDVDFPVTAAILRAKAKLIAARNMSASMSGTSGEPVVCTGCGQKIAKFWSGRVRACGTSCIRALETAAGKRAQWSEKPAPSTGGPLTNCVKRAFTKEGRRYVAISGAYACQSGEVMATKPEGIANPKRVSAILLIPADGPTQAQRDLLSGLVCPADETALGVVHGTPTTGFDFSDIGDALGDAGNAVGTAAKNTVNALANAVSDLGDAAKNVWDKYGGVVEVMGGWIPGPQIWAGETAAKLLKGIADDKNLGDVMTEQTQRFAKGMQAASPFVAMIPGLGTGVAMMMNASAAIALAEPLDQMAIETISGAIPGGPIAQAGFKTAATFGSGMLRGEPWDQAAIEAARSNVPSELQPAFDAGLALARGKSLQDAGFQALYAWTKGNDLLDRAAHFTENVTKAAQQGRDVRDVLIDEAVKDITSDPAVQKLGLGAANGLIDKTVDAVSKDPSLLQMFPSELADKLKVPESIARAAMQAVKILPGNIAQVDPAVLNRLNPSKTLERFILSPAAVTMTYASMRPQGSLVTNPAVLAQKLNAITVSAAAGDPDGIKAKDALARAQRALNRRTWVDWYKKIESAQGTGPTTLTGPIVSTPPASPTPSTQPKKPSGTVAMAISNVSQRVDIPSKKPVTPGMMSSAINRGFS